MTPGARLASAIEVLDAMQIQHRPAAQALADWGRAHRFAGSGDRAAIGNLVYDALRRRASIAARMGEDTPRALALGALAFCWGESPEAVAAMCDGSKFAPAPLSDSELEGLMTSLSDDAPRHIRGDYPEWLDPSLTRAFGARAAEEGAALAARAPVDIRCNTIKAERGKLLGTLAKYAPSPTPYSPFGIRFAAPEGPGRSPHLESDAAHGKGWFEVQDEGSQLAALLAGARPGLQVADLCAGSGGKTLALAAAMGNKGQIHAWDADPKRLRPIFERLKRAGIRNAQVLRGGEDEPLEALAGKMDIVVVDAPCSGSGVWRRRPDAKWRLREPALEQRRAEQRLVLDRAAGLVKPGGRLVYITCSLLPEENGDQVADFLARHPAFAVVPYGPAWRETMGGEPPQSADGRETALLLTPARHGTDGFFVALLEKAIH